MSMFDNYNSYDDIYNSFSFEDDVNEVEYVDTVGSNPDGGADVENPTNISEAPDADECFNEDHANDVPASVEELEGEISEGDNQEAEIVEDLSSDVPGEIEATDVEIDEEAGEVETNDVNVDAEPLSAAAETSDEPETLNTPTEENPDGEMGIDMDHAIECLFNSREEEIQVIVGDTEVSIDEAGKVSVDQNGDGGDSSSDDEGGSSDDLTNDDNSSDDNNSDDNAGTDNEGGSSDDNAGTDNNNESAESMFLNLNDIFNNGGSLF